MTPSLLRKGYTIDTGVVSSDANECTFTSTVTSAHTKTISPGTTQSDIGTTKVTTKCTNSSDHQVYAIGYSNDTDGNTNLINSVANATIATGTATSGNVSNWAMKIAKDTSSYEPSNLTITNSFGSYHNVPSSSTQVSSYEGATDSSTGSSITTTYRAKISDTQVSGSYVGKVKYTLTATMIYDITIKTVTGISKVTLNGVECTSTSGCLVSGLTEGESYTLVATLATGYNFASWNAGTNGSVASTSSASTTYTVGSGNSTITPSVTAKQYTITLNGNGATTAGSSSTKATYGSSTLNAITRPVKQYTVSGFTLPASNNADGADVTSASTITSSYTFRGWFKESAATNLIASNAATPVLASSTSYTDGNGNWSYDGTRTLYAGWTPQMISLPNITKLGYDCGWTETATNATTKDFQTGESLTPDRNYVLYGVCIPIDYTVTVTAGTGISTLALSGWTGTGTGTLTKTFRIGDTIDLSTFTRNYLTGFNGAIYGKYDNYGSMNGYVYTVGAGNGILGIRASSLDTPTCTMQGGATKVYNRSDTNLIATDVSDSYASNSVNITYSFGYASSASGELVSFSEEQESNYYPILKNAFRGSRYYGVKVTVTSVDDNSITATCTSGTGSSTGTTVANRTTMTLINSRVQLEVGDGTLSGTPYFYVYYGGASANKYSTRTGTTSYTLPTVTPPSGYSFDGWYTSGGDKVMNADFSLTGTAVSSWSNSSSKWVKTGTSDSSTNAANILYAHYTFNGAYLQNLPSSSCTTTASTAYDNRDMQTYTIQRLDDGNCWMMDNLNLGAVALTGDLTSSNTNLSTTVTASTFNGWLKTSGTRTFNDGEYIPISGTDATSGTKYGTLYNYYAASAGTISTNLYEHDATYDICPAGWRLPTGGDYGEFLTLYNNYNSYADMRASIANGGAAFALPGSFSNSTPTDLDTSGLYWSSTRFGSSDMYVLRMSGTYSSVTLGHFTTATRWGGYPIRCILKKPTSTLTVSYGTGVSGVTVNGVALSSGDTIALEQGARYTIDMTPTTRYGFGSWSATTGTLDSSSTKYTYYTMGSSNATLSVTATYVNTAIQNLSSSSCTTTPSYAYDTRDNQVYTIKKLSDGKCWMMDNLNLGAITLSTNLTSSNTNLSSTISASAFNGWKKTSNTLTYTDGVFISQAGNDIVSRTAYGTSYNYCAASAGTICTDASSPDATADLCPAGWRMPSSYSSGSDYVTLLNNYSTMALVTGPVAGGGAAFTRSGGLGVSNYYYNTSNTAWGSTMASTGNQYASGLDIGSANTGTLSATTGHGRNGVGTLRCVLKSITINNLTFLQDFKDLSDAEKNSVLQSMSYGVNYTLIDNRDNKSYKVAKLQDNNIWMAENLDLGRTTLSTNLTNDNTNISSTVTASTFNGWKKTSAAGTYTAGEFINVSGTDSTSGTAYGTLYNFYAASGGTVSGTSYSISSMYDICPAGWRLPSGGKYGEFPVLNVYYNSSSLMRTPITSSGAAFNLAGYFYNSTPTSQGGSGYFWTSTRYSNTNMYNLNLNSSSVYPSSVTGYRNYGHAIRCIVKRPSSSLTVTYGTGISSVKINGVTVQNGAVLELELGYAYTIEATTSSGYSFSNWSTTYGTIGYTSDRITTFGVGFTTDTLTASAHQMVYMQDITKSQCQTMTASGPATVYDSRDNRPYKINYLADGNCWMLDNLGLGSSYTTSLTSSNTNITGSYTLPASTTTINSYTTAQIYSAYKDTTTTTYGSGTGRMGVFYNYCALSAGTVCSSSNSSNATQDICPKGWHLPTGNSSGQYQALRTATGSASAFNTALSVTLSGVYRESSLSSYGSAVFYYSSSVYDSTSMYGPYITGSSAVDVLNYTTRNSGWSARCVKTSDSTTPTSVSVTVYYGTGVSSIRVNNTTVSNGGSISLTPGSSYSITMTPSTNYTFSNWYASTGSVTSTYSQTTYYTPTTSNATLIAYASFSGTYMQNLSSSSCTTTASTVYDNRDGQAYTIKRLNDGRCWMMSNLNLGATTLSTNLTSSNTNIASTVAYSTFNGWKKTSGTATYTAGEFISVSGSDATSGNAYGTLYNYCAATAGTICSSTNSGDAAYDICPAGWRMPTGSTAGELYKLYTYYPSLSSMRASASSGGAAFALAGYFTSGAATGAGTYGYYWSSTRWDDTTMYQLFLNSTDTVTPAGGGYRMAGFPVRCILDETATIPGYTYMQDFYNISSSAKASVLNSMSLNTTYTLIDNRDNKKYQVAKLRDGKIWMAENLDLGRTTLSVNLTSSNTNLANTITASTFNSWKKTTGSQSFVSADFIPVSGSDATSGNNYATLYNYCAATAGTICTSSNSYNASYDLCPAGWRMPTGGPSGEFQTIYSYYNSVSSLRSPITSGGFAFTLSGYFSNSGPAYQGGSGSLWSQTRGDNIDTLNFDVNGSSVYTYVNVQRQSGESVRCVVK